MFGHTLQGARIVFQRRIYTFSDYTLQKQVGCFNHRVVTLVADKLERQRLLEVCFDVED